MITETANRENGLDDTPTFTGLSRRTLATILGALENRAELFMVEAQEEKGRAIGLILVGIGALFLAMMTVLLLTGTIIFLVPEEYRLWAAVGFIAIYLAGTVSAVLGLKSLLKRVPFGETLNQIKRDSDLLDAFK